MENVAKSYWNIPNEPDEFMGILMREVTIFPHKHIIETHPGVFVLYFISSELSIRTQITFLGGYRHMLVPIQL